MNRLLTLLTAAGFVASAGVAAAMPVGVDHSAKAGTPGITRIQLGGGGPVGGGPNGSNNGTGTGVGNGVFRGGVTGGSTAGTGTAGAVSGGPRGVGTSTGLRPNGGNQQPNGSKPAPMQPNGVRKVE